MEKIDKYKKSIGTFIFSEFIIFLSQVSVFFMAAVFTSKFLSDEKKLMDIVGQKINDGSLGDLGLTFLAILVVIGFFTTIGKVFDNKYVEYYVHEVLCEIPKTIYIFGSAATGVMLAVILFIKLNPDSETSTEGLVRLILSFSLIIFIYGCGFSYAFNRRSHIRTKSNKSIQPTADAASD